MKRESSDESISGEVRLDMEESELSDSSNELVDPPDASDALVDETAPIHSGREINLMVKSKKKGSKKKNGI